MIKYEIVRIQTEDVNSRSLLSKIREYHYKIIIIYLQHKIMRKLRN